MRNHIFFIAITFGLCASLQVKAQSRRQTKDSSVTIIFSESTRTASTKKRTPGEDNIVKISPLGFLSGRFPLLYERRISDFFTIEVGAGLTNRNFVRGVFVRAGDSDNSDIIKEYPWSSSSNNDYDVAEPLYSFENRKPQMGFMYQLEPRIYFDSEAPDGGYLGLQYNFSKYRFSIPAMVNGEHNGTSKTEYENVMDYMVHFGNQWLNDRITLETSAAIGLRKIKGEKYVVSNRGQEGFASYSKSGLNFGLNLTVGFHF